MDTRFVRFALDGPSAGGMTVAQKQILHRLDEGLARPELRVSGLGSLDDRGRGLAEPVAARTGDATFTGAEARDASLRCRRREASVTILVAPEARAGAGGGAARDRS